MLSRRDGVPDLPGAPSHGARQRPRTVDNIRCSVLLAWPVKDRIFPYKRYGRPLREALPEAELRMLDDVGHLPMLDDPALVAALIRDFVRRPTR
jgi:pimeloyl-ACP methyl ester carboxylesterase